MSWGDVAPVGGPGRVPLRERAGPPAFHGGQAAQRARADEVPGAGDVSLVPAVVGHDGPPGGRASVPDDLPEREAVGRGRLVDDDQGTELQTCPEDSR